MLTYKSRDVEYNLSNNLKINTSIIVILANCYSMNAAVGVI